MGADTNRKKANAHKRSVVQELEKHHLRDEWSFCPGSKLNPLEIDKQTRGHTHLRGGVKRL